MLFSLSCCISESLLLQQISFSIRNWNGLNLGRFSSHSSFVHKEDLRIKSLVWKLGPRKKVGPSRSSEDSVCAFPQRHSFTHVCLEFNRLRKPTPRDISTALLQRENIFYVWNNSSANIKAACTFVPTLYNYNEDWQYMQTIRHSIWHQVNFR